MTKEEILDAIEDTEKNLQVALDSMHGTFVLNTAVSSILKEFERLQNECAKDGHKFEFGQCIYCHAEEPTEWR